MEEPELNLGAILIYALMKNPAPPAGVIHAYAGPTAPEGYLLCQGQAVSRTEYAELYAAIGTTYGGGNGSTTFNLPDLKGRVPQGAGYSDATYSLGGKGGATNVTLTEAQMPKHSHQYNNGYAIPAVTNAGPINGVHYSSIANGTWAIKTQPTTSENITAAKITNVSKGGGGAHGNMPPYLVVNYIISTGK